MRRIAGVSKSVNFNAVSVRLGELPLHYALALQALSRFYRIQSGRTGEAMSNLLEDFQSDNTRWNTSRFLAPAKRNVTYFQQFSELNLLESGSSKCFTSRLRQAMYNELTETWKTQAKASFTRNILPTWKPWKFNKHPFSKATETVLIKSCFEQNFTLSFKNKCNPATIKTCRLCKSNPETIEHLFLKCPVVEKQRENLRKAMDGEEFDLRSILGKEATMRFTEIFISESKFVRFL